MDNETDVTREQMDETRASMSEKIETLEQRMVDSVQDAANVVEGVKDAVNETVENVKDAFDLHLQMTRHPWAMVGGSIALGCLGGYLFFRRGAAQPRPNVASQSEVREGPPTTEKQNGVVKEPRFHEEVSGKKPIHAHGSDPGWLSGVRQRFGPEIDKVKGLAIGMALRVVRDVIAQSVHGLVKNSLTDVIDEITVKLGGEPIHGSVPKDDQRLGQTENSEQCGTQEPGHLHDVPACVLKTS